MKTRSVLSLALLAACSPVWGQAIFQDDFSTSETNGDPSFAIWGTAVRNPTADKTIKVTTDNSLQFFGEANNGYLRLSHKAGSTGSLFIQANNQFSTPSQVVTVGFDFYVPSVTSWGDANSYADPRVRLGVSGAFASNNNRVPNEFRFQTSNGGFSGSSATNIYSQDTTHSISFVYNHSTAAIDYGPGDSLNIPSAHYDVWIDGVRVIEAGGGASTLLAIGTDLTTLGIGSFAGGSEMFVDNLTVFEGAQAAIPEPGTYAVGAGLLSLAAVAFHRRRRREG